MGSHWRAIARDEEECARSTETKPLWEWGPRPQLFLGLLTALVFLRTASFGFVNYDDGQYVYENPWVRNGVSQAGVVWAFSTLHAGISYWHPLTWLSHQLDCQFFGLRPGPQHLTNVWLHVANTLLLFGVLRQLGIGAKAACFVAGLFGVHPLHVESVAWIAERKDVLYSLFWLSALHAYIRWRNGGTGAWYAGALCCFILSLMSKPAALTLPVVLVLLELVLPNGPPGARPVGQVDTGVARHLWRRGAAVLPFLLLSLGSGLLTILAQTNLGAMQGLALLPVPERMDNALISYVLYLRRTFLPVDLCASYVRIEPPSTAALALAFTILSGISWYAFTHRRRYPLVLFGWLWFLLTLIPNIGLIQAGPQSMADRYTYLSLVGVFLMLLGLAEQLTARGVSAVVLELSGLTVLGLCAFVSFQQLDHWKSGVTLFGRAVELNGDNWVAQMGLGAALTQERRFDEALPHLERALSLPGNKAEPHRQLGLCLYWKGDTPNALAHIESALRQDPSSAETHFFLANILSTHNERAVRDGQRAVALSERGIALRVRATAWDWLTLATAYAENGRFDEAMQTADRAGRTARLCGDQEIIREIQARLAFFRAGKPFREDIAPAPAPPAREEL